MSTDSKIRARVIEKVTRVIRMNHTEYEKKQAVQGRDRLNFACPYCGDSTSDPRKKRGNIYWADLYFHCYNCNQHKNVDEFLRDFNESLEGEERVTLINSIKESRKKFSKIENLDFYLFEKLDELALDFNVISDFFGCNPINEVSARAYPYLKSRLLHHKLNNFGYNPRTQDLYVFNFNRAGKIIGFQVRSLSGRGPKYRTYNIEKIYDRISQPLNLDEEEIAALNKISMIFGSMTSNFSDTLTIFEGPIDALFMRNSIGLTGVKKKVMDFGEIQNVRYFFDSDIEGKRKMLEKLREGKTVFMWKKFFDDHRINPKIVKDLNDLVKYEYKYKKGCLKNLDDYFTDNSLDAIYI